MKPRWLGTYRARILAVVLGVAMIPLGLIGFWLLGSAARSGERLLRARLSEALEEVRTEVARRWLAVRSELLDLADSESVQAALRVTEVEAGPYLATASGLRRPRSASRVVLSGLDERTVLELVEPDDESAEPVGFGRLPVELPVYDRERPVLLGTLRAEIAMRSLFPPGVSVPGAAGVLVGAYVPGSDVALIPLPFDPAALGADRLVWGGEDWLAVRRTLGEPRVEVVVAAPLTPFTRPFAEAARRGAWLLGGVGAGALVLTVLLTGRLTSSLSRLADAADAVARGDLRRTVRGDSEDEVGRVARAFNTMTESLNRTLERLSEREVAAATGEFAASLAHEVRNPLTAIRLDLQRVEEELPRGSPLREAQAHALNEIARLDRTVGEALDAARQGQLGVRRVSLSTPLRAAVHAATPAFGGAGADLVAPVDDWESIEVRGEPGSLEQLFLNLLLNSAEALEPGGRAVVDVHADRDTVTVSVADDGGGIPPEVRDRLFQPFVSTREGGTGLGLTIARRIAIAHGGRIDVESPESGGTLVRVRLPTAARS